MFERSDTMKLTVKVKDLVSLLEKDKAKAEKKYNQRMKTWEREVDVWKKMNPEGATTPPRRPSDDKVRRGESLIEMLRLHQVDTVEINLREYQEMRGEIGWCSPQYLASGIEEYVTKGEMRDRIADEVTSELENPA